MNKDDGLDSAIVIKTSAIKNLAATLLELKLELETFSADKDQPLSELIAKISLVRKIVEAWDSNKHTACEAIRDVLEEMDEAGHTYYALRITREFGSNPTEFCSLDNIPDDDWDEEHDRWLDDEADSDDFDDDTEEEGEVVGADEEDDF